MLDINNLPSEYRLIKTFPNYFGPQKLMHIIEGKDSLIFFNESKLNEAQQAFLKKSVIQSTFSLPLSSLDWVVDVIENGFMKLPSEGGLSADTRHVKNSFDRQELKVRFSPNCLAEGEKGITLINLSIPDDVSSYTELQLPYVSLLEQGILAELKRIAQNYKNA